VAIAISVVGIFGPPLFGRLDPGDATRRQWIVRCALGCAALFVVMAFARSAPLEIAAALLIGVLSGYGTLQYADVRAAYPAHMTGRAMAVFTMAMFLGVAVMQWTTGGIASAAQSLGVETFAAVLCAIAAFLVLGALAFRALPAPAPAGQASQSRP
jgi:hypothetical protein